VYESKIILLVISGNNLLFVMPAFEPASRI